MHAIPALLVLLLPFFSLAQVTITGIVKDAANLPLSGATVNLKNSTLGTSTDITGKFSLTIPGRTGVIVISFIGYSAQTIDVDADHKNLSINLADAAGKLAENTKGRAVCFR